MYISLECTEKDMTLAQGFIARKLLGEIRSEAIMPMAALASAPSPSFSSNPSLPAVGGSALSTAPYDNTSHNVNPPHTNMIVIITLFVVIFFATLLSAHIQRYYLRHNTDAVATIMPYDQPPSPPHGLDSNILETLPKVIFSSVLVRQKMQTECIICLEEFTDDQTLQILPQCGHGFHPECIHMWLFSHTTCPLCRHSLLIPLKPSASSSTEVAAYDSVGIGGVTLTDQQPSTVTLPVPNSVTAATISIIPVETESVANPNGGKSKPRRSHSTGHFPIKEEMTTYSSSPPLQSFITNGFHRCRSYTTLSDLSQRASQPNNQCYPLTPSLQ